MQDLTPSDFRNARVCDANPTQAASIVRKLLQRTDRRRLTTDLGKFEPEAFTKRNVVTYHPDRCARLIDELLTLDAK